MTTAQFKLTPNVPSACLPAAYCCTEHTEFLARYPSLTEGQARSSSDLMACY
jgi:hypothetical protein